MLKIKLARIGKKGQPQYHIVVSEDRTKSRTDHVAEIGYYNPLTKPHEFRIDQASYADWLKKGARPTDTVRELVLRNSKTTTSSRAKSRDLDSSTTVGMT